MGIKGYSITFPIKNKYVFSVMSLCNPWTVAHQAPLSLGFSRQEYWSSLLLPTLPDPGIELTSCESCIGRQIHYHCAT